MPSWEAKTSNFLHVWCDAVGDRTPASHMSSGRSNHYATRGWTSMLLTLYIKTTFCQSSEQYIYTKSYMVQAVMHIYLSWFYNNVKINTRANSVSSCILKRRSSNQLARLTTPNYDFKLGLLQNVSHFLCRWIQPDIHVSCKFTGCALTDRHFAKCETNCRVAKNKCVPVATLAKDCFSVYIVMPGNLSPVLAKCRENTAISSPQGCAASRQAALWLAWITARTTSLIRVCGLFPNIRTCFGTNDRNYLWIFQLKEP